jgi:hypothetical protein
MDLSARSGRGGTQQLLTEPTDHRHRLEVGLRTSLTDDERRGLPAAAGIEDAYPLTAMQELIVRNYDDPDLRSARIYHYLAVWRLRDTNLCLADLNRALCGLVLRHRCLRTSIAAAHGTGRMVQVIHPPADPPIRLVDLRTVGGAAGDAALRELVDADLDERYEVGSGRPFARLWLVPRSPRVADVVISAHHAVMDSWTNRQLQRELLADYDALRDDQPVDQSAPPADPFQELVARERLAGEDNATRIYWHDRLATLSPAPDERVGGRPRRASTVVDTVDAATTAQLRQRAVDVGVSVDAVCVAAFLEALHPDGRQDRSPFPTVAVLTDERHEQLADPVTTTGLCWNVLPLPAVPADPVAVQASLDELDRHARFPLAGALAERSPALACIEVLPLHGTPWRSSAPGRHLQLVEEPMVHEHFHHPLVLTVSFEPDANGGTGLTDVHLGVRVDHDPDMLDATGVNALLTRWRRALTHPPA